MILELFGVFVGLSFVMIYIGLSKPTESAQALIGFLFLFLLSFVLMGNNLEYRIGEQTTTTYSYLVNTTDINFTIEQTNYTYTNYADTTSQFNTHRAGYFLALVSAIGFIGVLYGIKTGGRN